MEIIVAAYLFFGLIYANGKVNNPNPALRPLWASDRSLPFLLRLVGFLVIALLWPVLLVVSERS